MDGFVKIVRILFAMFYASNTHALLVGPTLGIRKDSLFQETLDIAGRVVWKYYANDV